MAHPDFVWAYHDKRDGLLWYNVPSLEFASSFTSGWMPDAPRGYVEQQIEGAIAQGHLPDAAARFVRGRCFGGHTTGEAFAIMRDRDLGHIGIAIEAVKRSDMPLKWFRDAWRRSHNGGPISIDLKTAQRVQWAAIRRAVDAELKWRDEDLFREAPALEVEWFTIEGAIRGARDELEVFKVWPDGVPRPRPEVGQGIDKRLRVRMAA